MSIQALFDLFQTTYCERTGPGPFSEPLNALSNLAFALAAVLAARHIRSHPDRRLGIRLLPWLLALVAIGSTLYHTYRGPVTFILDVVPLSALILGALFLSLHRLVRSRVLAVLGITAFLGLQAILLLLVPRDFINGSTPYLVTVLVSIPVMSWGARRYPALWRQVVGITLLFAFAIVIRSMDRVLCPWLPIGTHLLWHLAGAGVGFLVVRFVAALDGAGQGLPGLMNGAGNAT